jgi:CDP-diglyceride synthetase
VLDRIDSATATLPVACLLMQAMGATEEQRQTR